MKKILYILVFICVSSVSFSQYCVYLGCAENYTQTTNNSLPAVAAPSSFSCYGSYTFRQVFWQYFYSPAGGNYVQAITSTNSSVDLDWIIFDAGTTMPDVNCSINTASMTPIACNTEGSAGITGGPGYEATATTIAAHYYLVGVTYWQGGSATFTLGAPTLGGTALTSANCTTTAGSTSANWTTTGNNGTSPATNFLGTTDNQPLAIKTNNTEAVRVLANGNTGIGVTAPTTKLDVNGVIKSTTGFTYGGATYGGTFDINGTHSRYSTNANTDAFVISTTKTLSSIRLMVNNASRGVTMDGNSKNFLFMGGSGETLSGIGNANGTGHLTLLYSTVSNSQTEGARLSNAGRLLIGTSTDDGSNRLQVNGTAKATTFRSDNGNGYYGNMWIADVNGWAFNFMGGSNIARINNTGVGIGTIPAAQLHTTGTVRFAGLSTNNNLINILVADGSGNLSLRDASTLGGNTANPNNWSLSGNAGINPATTYIGTTDNQPLIFKTSGAETMRINSSGQVTVGAVTAPSGIKLAVGGNIIAEKVTVKLITNWADFVFDDNYRLPTLTEVEKYISANKHLPDVPSAAEVQKEGLNLGDNQAVLLRKIEELTLYVIELNKKVEKLSVENNDLKKKADSTHK